MPAAKKKAAVKNVPGKTTDTSTMIKRSNRMFIQIKSIGMCDDNGRAVLSMGFSGKIIAEPDKPLALVRLLMREMLTLMDYSTAAAKKADMKLFGDRIAQFVADNT